MNSEFEKEFNIFETNVHYVARCFYNSREFERQSYEDTEKYNNPPESHSQDSPIYQALNRNPRFWNIYKFASINSVFITLGLIFDKNGNSHSIKTLLKSIKNSPDFSLEKLKERKICGSENANEWIGDFMLNKKEFGESDFSELEKYIDDTKLLWNNIGPIRHKIFAHQDRQCDEKEILNNATYDKIENIISRLLKIYDTIWNLYHNGTIPDFDSPINNTFLSNSNQEISELFRLLSYEMVESIR